MRSWSKGLVLMVALSWVGTAKADLQVSPLFGDHMVLQRGKPIQVLGQDKPGQKIKGWLWGNTASARADEEGEWKLKFPAMPEGGPHELVLEGSSSVTLKDVLVGDIWLGSGQSNMDYPMRDTHDAAKTLPAAKDGSLRLFKQAMVMSPKPLSEPRGQWVVCSPETVKDFSAVAYHFGRELRKGSKVPVGLIESCWGGSYIESWMPGKELAKKRHGKVRERWFKLPANKRRMWEKGGAQADLRLADLEVVSEGKGRKPLKVPFLAASVGSTQSDPPGIWSSGVKEGSVIKFEPVQKKGWALGRQAHLTGKMLPDAWGWISTPLAGAGKPADLTGYDAFEFLAKGEGKYILFVSEPSITDWDNYRTETFEVGSKWKKVHIPFSSLKQSGWGKQKPFTKEAVSNVFFGIDPKPLSEFPSGLYNAMIHPFLSFPIKGVLWYQGEANTVRPSEYGTLLKGLIEGWRKAWDDKELPFLYAQLPLFMAGKPEPSESAWAEVREQQRLAQAVPHTGMAVLMDLGEAGDIHPRNKTDVGARLAKVAQRNVYGKKEESLAPTFEDAVREGAKVRVRFKDWGKGLKVKGGPKGFALAGKDGKYHWAEAKIEKDSVLVWSHEVPEPLSLRYAWADNPVLTLYGKNDLPVGPFQAQLPGPK